MSLSLDRIADRIAVGRNSGRALRWLFSYTQQWKGRSLHRTCNGRSRELGSRRKALPPATTGSSAANDPHLEPSAPSIWYQTHLSAPGLRVAGVTFPGVPGIISGHNERIAWGMTNLGPDVQDLYAETIEGDKYKTPGGWQNLEHRREE